MKIAILDDYQNVARSYADWSRLPPQAELVVVNENIPDPDALAAFDGLFTGASQNIIAGATYLKVIGKDVL